MAKTTVCPTCGGTKDPRAAECRSCGMSRKGREQWANAEVRSRMVDSLRAVHGKRRRTFDMISENTNWMIKSDGRAYTYYWEGNKKRYIYRYQWRWMQTNGPIPAGYVIHHRNGDHTDDTLVNLECMDMVEHSVLHAPDNVMNGVAARGITPIAQKTATCERCGATFTIKTRGKANRFCSLTCYHGKGT